MNYLTLITVCLLASPPIGLPQETPSAQETPSVWAVDLVRTKPDSRADYLEYLSVNWALVREEMKKVRAVRSFKILTAPADAAAAWDVMLVTEYASRAAYDAREETYKAAVARIRPPGEGPRLIRGRGARDLSTIVSNYALDVYPGPSK